MTATDTATVLAWIVLPSALCLILGLTLGWWLSAHTGQRRHRHTAHTPHSDEAGIIAVLGALRQAVIVLDRDDEVLHASRAAYDYNLIRHDVIVQPQVAQMVERVRVDEVAQDRDLTLSRSRLQGSGQFYVHVRTASIGQGRVLILVDDLTAQKRLEAMRRDFTVNISHELKTPIGAISLLAETIEQGADDPTVIRHFAPRLRKEATRLGTLVQEIIELSRLQEGDALASPEEVDVDAVIAESVDRVKVAAEAADIAVVTGGTRGLKIRGDASLIATAVRNLLENAIRYSDPKTRVSVGVSVDPGDGDLVRIAVVDQGIGISKDDQERVFERFYRVDKARSRATGGTGLGLSIVKHVAADHGGTVELWSALGRGSTFTLVLPRLSSQSPQTSTEEDSRA